MPQSQFGNNLFQVEAICPKNGTGVLKRLFVTPYLNTIHNLEHWGFCIPGGIYGGVALVAEHDFLASPFLDRSPVFRDKPLKYDVVCPQCGTAVLKGFNGLAEATFFFRGPILYLL